MNRARKALPEEYRRTGVKSVKFQRRQWPVAARLEVLEAWSRNEELPTGRRKSKRRFCEARGLQNTQLNQWIAQRELLLGTHGTSKRVQSGDSQDRGKFRQMEKDLQAWILDLQGQHFAITRRSIMREALRLVQLPKYGYSEDDVQRFKAGQHWCQRFMIRFGLALRRRTSCSQKLPADLVAKVEDFQAYTKNLCEEFHVGDDH